VTDPREERFRYAEAVMHLSYLRDGLVACPGILGRGCLVLLPVDGPAFMCRYHAAKRRAQLEVGDVLGVGVGPGPSRKRKEIER
jgi:hypothetical protein